MTNEDSKRVDSCIGK